MTDEQKKIFTRRISNASHSELMVILCDMFLTYVAEAMEGLKEYDGIEESKEQTLKSSFRNAKACLREMIHDLPQHTAEKEVAELTNRIHALYHFVEVQLSRAQAGRNVQALAQAQQIMTSLRNAYAEVSKRDDGPKVMANTEKVYAGITYGQHAMQESSVTQPGRGFWA